MELQRFVCSLEDVLPPDTAMEGDRIGLQLQSGRATVSSILVAMEVTDSVLQEAIDNGCDCIVAFHPLLFVPTTSLQDNERVGWLCTRLIQHSIAVVIAHTNFDAFPQGTSTLFAQRLGLTVEDRLVRNQTRAGFGMGIIATSSTPLPPATLLERVQTVCNSPLRYTTGSQKVVERVAIVGGSGATFISQALAAKVDVFITADIKYHDFHRVHGAMWLIDPGHYEMEQFVPEGLYAIVNDIAQNNPSLSIKRSQVLPNPVQYYPGADTYKQAQQEYLHI